MNKFYIFNKKRTIPFVDNLPIDFIILVHNFKHFFIINYITSC